MSVIDNSPTAAVPASEGVVLSIKKAGRTKDPTALGAWEITVAVKDSRRKIRVPLTKLGAKTGIGMYGTPHQSLDAIKTEFEDESTEGREKRYIGTGNILAAFEELKDGHIVFFTDRNGGTRLGVLMPRSFNPTRWQNARPVVITKPDEAIRFMEQGGMLTSPDKAIQIGIFGESLVLRSPKSRQRSGQYTTNADLLQASGTVFVTKGQLAEMVVPPSKQRATLETLLSMTGMQTVLEKDKDLARRIIGGELSMRRAKYSIGNKAKPSKPEVSRRNMRPTPAAVFKKKDIVSTRDLVYTFGKLFRVPIRRGNFGQRAYGIYKVHPEVVRMARDIPNDVAVAMHEIGHHIDKKSGAVTRAPEHIKAMLEDLDGYSGKGLDYEGFAELVRMYVTLPEALDTHPSLVDWLENQWATDTQMNMELFAKLKTARELAGRYADQSAFERAHSAISNAYRPAENLAQSKRESILEAIHNQTSEFMINWVDRFHGLRVLQEKAEQRGYDYSQTGSAYEFAQASNRAALSHAERAYKDGVHTITSPRRRLLTQDGGIRSIQNDLTKFEFDKLGAYLHAKITLFDRGHNTGLDPQDAQIIVDEIETDPKLFTKFGTHRARLQ